MTDATNLSDRASITIYHNPVCGTSRNTLAAIRAAGHEPAVIDYRVTGWRRSVLEELCEGMHVGARDLLRTKEPIAVRAAPSADRGPMS